MSARPDEAVINIGVQSSASTAAEALDANSQQMQKVLARLKADGIPDSAIETSDVSVYGYPIHDPKTNSACERTPRREEPRSPLSSSMTRARPSTVR